jgi:hypothetical protein
MKRPNPFAKKSKTPPAPAAKKKAPAFPNFKAGGKVKKGC